ncbi:hypothetical protein EPI10_032469 [Gossypium australe]|uniref:Uncharacterized protein n=1 Tax=Gossypium australe TaxID=47621 RepID=A0A5B6X3F1_9ROSI|nr:hypothetical protein EPI10_032469 [Gossypium australe]
MKRCGDKEIFTPNFSFVRTMENKVKISSKTSFAEYVSSNNQPMKVARKVKLSFSQPVSAIKALP